MLIYYGILCVGGWSGNSSLLVGWFEINGVGGGSYLPQVSRAVNHLAPTPSFPR